MKTDLRVYQRSKSQRRQQAGPNSLGKEENASSSDIEGKETRRVVRAVIFWVKGCEIEEARV